MHWHGIRQLRRHPYHNQMTIKWWCFPLQYPPCAHARSETLRRAVTTRWTRRGGARWTWRPLPRRQSPPYRCPQACSHSSSTAAANSAPPQRTRSRGSTARSRKRRPRTTRPRGTASPPRQRSSTRAPRRRGRRRGRRPAAAQRRGHPWRVRIRCERGAFAVSAQQGVVCDAAHELLWSLAPHDLSILIVSHLAPPY